jgi:plastocyanin
MKMPLALALLAVVLPAAVAAETHTVTIDGMKFQPETITVKRGDTVVWRNRDVVPHTATATGRFDSGLIAARANWSWTASQAGRFDYVCTYHPGMKAAVVVQ